MALLNTTTLVPLMSGTTSTTPSDRMRGIARWSVHARRSMAQLAMWVGLFLLSLTIVGHGYRFGKSSSPVGYGIDGALSVSRSMKDDESAGRRETLRTYYESMSPSRFHLRTANAVVHRNTLHSVERRIAWYENWLQWSLGYLYRPLSRTQNTPLLIEGGLADCSERSQILKSIAEKAGAECRFVGLDGHVVLEVNQKGVRSIADPDYGCVYQCSAEQFTAPEYLNTIHSSLRRRGYNEAMIDTYVDIVQSTANNKVCSVGAALSPRLEFVERSCVYLVWLLPMSLILCGWVTLPLGESAG